MRELLIALQDIPAEGRQYTVSDQELWRGLWKEFELGLTPGRDIEADVHLLPQGDGCLVRGTLRGSVNIPCDRCAEPFEHAVDLAFEEFETVDKEGDEPSNLVVEDGVTKLNLGSFLWELFALDLPIHPTCAENCKGLCPGCGVNLNETDCDCDREDGDARLAVFRNLKLS